MSFGDLEFHLHRKVASPLSVIGELDEESFGKVSDALELPWKDNAEKVSCIPPGRYQFVLEPILDPYGHRHMHLLFAGLFPALPMILGVPGREGIFMHPANEAGEIEGCIPPGDYDPARPDWVSNSRAALKRIIRLCQPVVDAGAKLWITITDETPGLVAGGGNAPTGAQPGA